MKPFDLEQAKAGKPLVTRDGRDAKFIAHVPEARERNRIVVLIGDEVLGLNDIGACLDDKCDVFMKLVKRNVYVNIFDDNGRWVIHTGTYNSEISAEHHANLSGHLKYIAIAVPIEIEE